MLTWLDGERCKGTCGLFQRHAHSNCVVWIHIINAVDLVKCVTDVACPHLCTRRRITVGVVNECSVRAECRVTRSAVCGPRGALETPEGNAEYIEPGVSQHMQFRCEVAGKMDYMLCAHRARKMFDARNSSILPRHSHPHWEQGRQGHHAVTTHLKITA